MVIFRGPVGVRTGQRDWRAAGQDGVMEWPQDEELFESLRYQLRSERLGKGPWDQDAPAVASAIAALLRRYLAREISRVVPDQMIQFASSLLAECQDAHYRANVGPATGTLVGASKTQALTRRSMAARILLEEALRNKATGRRRIDSALGPRLVNLADQTCQAHIAVDRARYGICRIDRIVLSRAGRIEFTLGDAPPFRTSRFERMYLARMASRPRTDNDDVAVAKQLADAVLTGASVPDELAGIDAGLREARGHGLSELVVALATLGLMAGGLDETVAGVQILNADFLPEFVGFARQKFPEHDPDVVATAIPYLTWTQDLLQRAQISFADYHNVPARLLSRPAIERPDQAFFVARTVPNFAMYILVIRVLEGTWVEDLTPEDAPLARALSARRSKIRPINGFEHDLAEVLRVTGLRHMTGVQQAPGGTSGIGVTLRHEIDAVVALPASSELWVIEAKDLAFPYSARRIRSELDKYLRRGGHLAKLAEKVEDVNINPEKVAASIGAPAGDYRVRGVFVTRELSPAACLDGVGYPFVVLDDLATWLRQGHT